MPNFNTYESEIEYEDYLGNITGVEEIVIYYTATFHRGYRGATDGRFGPKLEPDEPAHFEIEIDHVTGQEGREIDLTTKQDERFCELIAEYESRQPQYEGD